VTPPGGVRQERTCRGQGNNSIGVSRSQNRRADGGDLDESRDPETGAIEAWAMAIVKARSARTDEPAASVQCTLFPERN
jgi:hypothetical protein